MLGAWEGCTQHALLREWMTQTPIIDSISKPGTNYRSLWVLSRMKLGREVKKEREGAKEKHAGNWAVWEADGRY